MRARRRGGVGGSLEPPPVPSNSLSPGTLSARWLMGSGVRKRLVGPPYPQRTRIKTTRPEMPRRQPEGRPPFPKAFSGKRKRCLDTEFSRFLLSLPFQPFFLSFIRYHQADTQYTSENTTAILEWRGGLGEEKRDVNIRSSRQPPRCSKLELKGRVNLARILGRRTCASCLRS